MEIGRVRFQRLRGLGRVFRDHLGRRSGINGRLARQCMEQGRAQRVDIATEIFGLAAEFFGRDVVGRSPNLVRDRRLGSSAIWSCPRARPKSTILGTPSSLKRILPGFHITVE